MGRTEESTMIIFRHLFQGNRNDPEGVMMGVCAGGLLRLAEISMHISRDTGQYLHQVMCRYKGQRVLTN